MEILAISALASFIGFPVSSDNVLANASLSLSTKFTNFVKISHLS